MKGFSVLYCGSRANVQTSRQTRSVSPVKDSNNDRRSIAAASARNVSPNNRSHRMTTSSTPLVQNNNMKKTEPTTGARTNRLVAVPSSAPNPKNTQNNNSPGSTAGNTNSASASQTTGSANQVKNDTVKLKMVHASSDKDETSSVEKEQNEDSKSIDTDKPSADGAIDNTESETKKNEIEAQKLESEAKKEEDSKIGENTNANNNTTAPKLKTSIDTPKSGRTAIADALKSTGVTINSLTASTASSAAKTQPNVHRHVPRPRGVAGDSKISVKSSTLGENTKSTLRPSVATVKSFQEQDLKLAVGKSSDNLLNASLTKNLNGATTTVKILPTLSLTTINNINSLPSQQVKTAVITVTSSDSVEGLKLTSVQTNSAAACLINDRSPGKLLINDLSSSATITFPSISGPHNGETTSNQGFTGTKYLNQSLSQKEQSKNSLLTPGSGGSQSARRRSRDRDRPDRGN